jgi:hypothetical protein
MSQVKHFLVFIITPAIPHGAFKMEVTFCVKAVYATLLAKDLKWKGQKSGVWSITLWRDLSVAHVSEAGSGQLRPYEPRRSTIISRLARSLFLTIRSQFTHGPVLIT